MLIDSHAHIQGKEYAGETEAVIARAHAAGVEMIVAVGGAGDMSSNTEAVRLANSFAKVYATVGMHPHDAKDVGADELAVLKQLAEDPKVVAIGETGLDYYYSHSPHDMQRRVFGQFIQMARQTNLPIVVHERDAAQEAVELLRSEGGGELRGVIHCFTGNYQAACAYLDLGFYLSFTGIITFKNAEPLREVVRQSAAGAHASSKPIRPISPRFPTAANATSPPMCVSSLRPSPKSKMWIYSTVAQATSANVKNLFCI